MTLRKHVMSFTILFSVLSIISQPAISGPCDAYSWNEVVQWTDDFEHYMDEDLTSAAQYCDGEPITADAEDYSYVVSDLDYTIDQIRELKGSFKTTIEFGNEVAGDWGSLSRVCNSKNSKTARSNKKKVLRTVKKMKGYIADVEDCYNELKNIRMNIIRKYGT